MHDNDYDDEIEYDPSCNCGEYFCPHCNGETLRPLTIEEEEARINIMNKGFIRINDNSYRNEGDCDSNKNPILISNENEEDVYTLSIRDFSSKEKNTLHFIEPDGNDYLVTLEED